MSEPVAAIFGKIVERLKTVKRTNGYGNDVKTIFEVPMSPDQLLDSNLPAFYVLEAEAGEVFTWDDANVYQAKLPLLVGGVCLVDNDDPKDAERVRRIRSLENDARKALLVDPFFGGTCKNSILQKTARYPDNDRGFAFFETDMYVLYHFNQGSL